MEPLAQRLRPRTLDEVCGQQHLLGKNQVFRRTVESGKIPNMIFYGPSGVGKTTVASIIAAGSGMQLHKLNGTTASTSDIKSVLADIGTLGASGGILLYLDEIQYFNKRQQQSLLECVEQGTVTLIASTTENPYFYVYNALLSRCTVFEFKSLTTDDIRTGLRSAAARLGAEDKSPVLIPDDALEYLAQSAGGDMRKALGNLEFAVTAAPVENGSRTITLDMVQQVAVRTAMRYDKLGDDHYDIVSAYQKSMRGSDPDAALHYLGRLLEAGDLPSACRRLMVCACEDVGLAWPQIIPIVKAAVDIANAAAGGCRGAGGYRAQVQLRPRRHQCRHCGHSGRAHRAHPAPAAKQALRRRGRQGQGAALPLPARLPQPLDRPAIPARRHQGPAVLCPRR